MRRMFVFLFVAGVVAGSAARPESRQAAEPVDVPAIARIRAEGLERSQVMDTAFWLTDRYGPRLDGSPEFEEAADWVMDRLRSWGVAAVAKERFPSPPGWSLLGFHATMTAPRVMPIVGMPKAWSPATRGTVTADVVRPIIESDADLAKYRGALRGKIVLLQPARPVRMLEHGDGTVLRYADHDGKWEQEAMSPPVPRGYRPGGSSGPVRLDLVQFYRDEGAIALFDRGPTSDLSAGGSDLSWLQQRPDGGTVLLQDEAVGLVNGRVGLPQVTLAVEHYNRMVRLLEHGVPVRVELNVSARFDEATRPSSFNIVGEIPGSDRASEVVLLGAHFDSWHGATGATDNAAGVAAMMEVLRILKATGLVPRRTVRIGLWGGEELGLVGSRAYAAAHFGTADRPAPDAARLAAYFNLDNGTGPIRGVWTQGNAAVQPIFQAWAAPLMDLGVTMISPRGVSQTDHVSFDVLGLPAFQFVQERYEYNSRTHHSSMDVYDRLQPDDLKQVATVAAVFAWHAATRDDVLPRRAAAGAAR
ncbi:MAG: M20/M25/M40 family metallo-hydrolase [Acidobacteria bacterium]|nr:M20/M25/M40 family metallo-hydrolase [Acidobacteriota bacterium]